MRGLDEWTEAITRVTQLGSRTNRQRQNHTQFFHAKSSDVAVVIEDITISKYTITNQPNLWADITVDDSDDAYWGLFSWA